MTRPCLAAILAAGLAVASPATAGAAGFTVRQTATVRAVPAAVYGALAERVGQWWAPAHTWSGDSRNLSIDPRPGGCFCERWASGGAEHMRVIHAVPGTLLRLTGALGPLQAWAVTGVLSWSLEPAGTGTRIEVIYAVSGEMAGGLEALEAPVGQVLGEQLGRLGRYVDTGSPEP